MLLRPALIGLAVVTWLDRKALPAEALQAILLGDFVIVATGLLTAVLDRLSIPSQERQCESGRQATHTQAFRKSTSPSKPMSDRPGWSTRLQLCWLRPRRDI